MNCSKKRNFHSSECFIYIIDVSMVIQNSEVNSMGSKHICMKNIIILHISTFHSDYFDRCQERNLAEK